MALAASDGIIAGDEMQVLHALCDELGVARAELARFHGFAVRARDLLEEGRRLVTDR